MVSIRRIAIINILRMAIRQNTSPVCTNFKGYTMSFDGKLVNSHTPNHHNTKSYFQAFEIITCREISDYEGGTIIQEIKTAEEFLNADDMAIDQPFYRVFGVYKQEYYKTRKALGDFYNVTDASIFIQEITGVQVYIYSY